MRPGRSFKAQANMFATPRQPRAGWLAQHRRTAGCSLVAVALVVFIVLYPTPDSSRSMRGSSLRLSPFATKVSLASLPSEIHFAIIADLDKRSAMEGRKPSWYSLLRKGVLVKSQTGYNVTWTDEHQIITKHGEAGRGMELSELLSFNGVLYSFDDRSGIVYEVANPRTEKPEAFPRHILMEGDGRTNKGFKIEWATRKNGEMVIGSFGKEYTDNDGNILNRNNMWVKTIDEQGRIRHEDWTQRYVDMRRHLDCDFPGYLLHEAAVWSESWQQWMFFPRRQSKLKYDDELDERRGTNIMIVADDKFKHFDVRTVTTHIPERGFSSVKEIPTVDGSRTSAVLALRSSEDGKLETQSAFLSVLGFDGVALMEELEIPGGFKYEGVEIFEVVP